MDPLEWLASNFSLPHHPCIKFYCHKSGGSDHQPKELLIVKQILLISTLENVKNSIDNTYTDIHCQWFRFLHAKEEPLVYNVPQSQHMASYLNFNTIQLL